MRARAAEPGGDGAGADAPLPEVALEPGTLLIGDLHLDVSAHGGDHATLASWLDTLVGVPRLVVLGDLFDAWVGPAHERLAPAQGACAALRALVGRGTRLDVLHGNRDFLLGAEFERASGARVFPRGFVGLLPGSGERALVVHGDELCTLDHAYQRMKRVLRSRAVRGLAYGLPATVTLMLARRLRATSVKAVAAKPPAAKEQQEAAVRALAARHRCSTLVCGHAHRFRDEALREGPRWRVVDAFGQGRDLLRVRPDGALEPGGSGSPSPP